LPASKALADPGAELVFAGDIDTGEQCRFLLLLRQPLLSHTSVLTFAGASMFVTSPHFEVPVSRDLLPKGGTCLQAVSLSSGSDWFVLTTQHDVEQAHMLQTTLVSWTSTLRSLLEQLAGLQIASLEWMRASANLRGWELVHVEEVWVPAEAEQPETGPLLFKVAATDCLLGEHGVRVSGNRSGRRRMFALAA
jgi:hypothetical protein